MDWGAIIYIGLAALMFLVFGALMLNAYSKDRKESGEEAKYRMMKDD